MCPHGYYEDSRESVLNNFNVRFPQVWIERREENRQKVLNLSAELCSLKAIEAQLERKANELTYCLKKTELANEKLKRQVEQEK